MTSLETEIKNIIEEVTKSKYIGKLKVKKESLENSTFWMLLLYLDTEFTPMILAYEGSESDFKDFIRTEMKSRKLERVGFWKAIQELPEEINDDFYE